MKRKARSDHTLHLTLYEKIYPVESPIINGGDEEKNVHSLLRVGFKAPPFQGDYCLGQLWEGVMIIGRKKVIVTIPVYGNKEYILCFPFLWRRRSLLVALHRGHRFRIR